MNGFFFREFYSSHSIFIDIEEKLEKFASSGLKNLKKTKFSKHFFFENLTATKLFHPIIFKQIFFHILLILS